jgi:SprT protein
MPKKEVPLMQLVQYLPENTYEPVAAYLNYYKVHLTVAKSRDSILGNYRHRSDKMHHRISVNGNLNKYAFLITLLHELAHLITFEKFGRHVLAHGKEWKKTYGQILAQFVEHKVFPSDVEKELLRTLHSPGASTCSEENLQRILYNYDDRTPDYILVENLSEGALFKIKGERVFRKGEKRTKRYKCTEISTGKIFLFSPIYEVKIVE